MKKVEGKNLLQLSRRRRKNTLLYSHFIIIVDVVQEKNSLPYLQKKERKTLLAGNNQMSIDLREQCRRKARDENNI